MLVDDRSSNWSGTIPRRSGDADKARPRLSENILARFQRHGSGRPEAACRSEYEVRVDFCERRLVESELGENARSEVLHHHVSAGDQTTSDFLALRALQVDG